MAVHAFLVGHGNDNTARNSRVVRFWIGRGRIFNQKNRFS